MSGLNGSDDSGDHNAWAVALALGIGSAVGRAGAAGVHAFARAGRPSSNTTDGGDTDDPGESGGGDDRGDDGQQKKKEDPCAKPPYPAGTSLDRNIRVSSIAILPGQRLSNFASWLVAVAPHSSSDYKNQCKTPTGTYEAAGNHNFGATGAAMGFSAATLHAAAGMVALMSDWTRVFTQSPHYFWDSPEDWGQIQRGIDYYSKGCSAK
ncbi:MAG TPA: polymorphic toxin type 44 domain-containing protein [Vicinamibacterales bacterium]